MSNITSKELSAVEDALKSEHLLVKKFQTYASQTTDPQIKYKCEQIAQAHQKHFDLIKSNLS